MTTTSDAGTHEEPALTGTPITPDPPEGPHPQGRPTPSGLSFESVALAGFIFGLFAVVVAVFAVALSARAVGEARSGGGGGGGGQGPPSVDITLADFSISPKTAAVSSTGTINLTNVGAVQHDLTIEDQASPMLQPGGTSELVLTGLSPGTYTMYCNVPGHRAAGMEGTITLS